MKLQNKMTFDIIKLGNGGRFMIVKKMKFLDEQVLFELAHDVAYADLLRKPWDYRLSELEQKKLKMREADEKDRKNFFAKIKFIKDNIQEINSIKEGKIDTLYKVVDKYVKEYDYIDLYNALVYAFTNSTNSEDVEISFGDKTNGEEPTTEHAQMMYAWEILKQVVYNYGIINAYIIPNYQDIKIGGKTLTPKEVEAFRNKQLDVIYNYFGILPIENFNAMAFATIDYNDNDRARIIKAGRSGKKVASLQNVNFDYDLNR